VTGSGNKKRAQAARQRARRASAAPARRPVAGPDAGRRDGGPARLELPIAPPAPPHAAPPAADPQPLSLAGQQPGEAASWAERALEEVLTATCWLDPGEDGEPYPVTVRFSGRRTGVAGTPAPGDSFAREETVERVVPGSGPVAVTATSRGINPGTWTVTATPASRGGHRAARLAGRPPGSERQPRLRRVRIPAPGPAEARTALLAFAKIPGIVRLAYPGLVGLGILAGLAIQALLLAGAHLPAGHGLAVSASAVAGGLAGAKGYYIAVNRGRRLDGWCIQGFVLGAAITVAVVTALGGLGMPAGAYAASAVPSLLTGMAIGRPGCFWAGCCVGRPTASRWGIWSSDRRVGARRLPSQLLEALLSLVTGMAALLTVLLLGLTQSGWAAAAALAAYTLGRQFILGTREEPPRRTPLSGQVTAAVAAAALAGAITMLTLTAR
jgi:phosphatidylglycerol:prolipoprotein diacylglycerol transferase